MVHRAVLDWIVTRKRQQVYYLHMLVFEWEKHWPVIEGPNVIMSLNTLAADLGRCCVCAVTAFFLSVLFATAAAMHFHLWTHACGRWSPGAAVLIGAVKNFPTRRKCYPRDNTCRTIAMPRGASFLRVMPVSASSNCQCSVPACLAGALAWLN